MDLQIARPVFIVLTLLGALTTAVGVLGAVFPLIDGQYVFAALLFASGLSGLSLIGLGLIGILAIEVRLKLDPVKTTQTQ